MDHMRQPSQFGKIAPAPSDPTMAQPTPRIISMQSGQASPLPVGSFEVVVQGSVLQYPHYFRSCAYRKVDLDAERCAPLPALKPSRVAVTPTSMRLGYTLRPLEFSPRGPSTQTPAVAIRHKRNCSNESRFRSSLKADVL